MPNLVPCKSCEKEVSRSAKTCPHCGHKLRGGLLKKLVLWPIGFLLFLGFIGAMLEEGGTVASQNATSTNKQEDRFLIGDSMNTEKFEIAIESVSLRSSVGTEFFASSPADGAVYVAVKWSYKNTTNKPIGIFSTPSVFLMDPTGTRYSPDIGASSSFATELDNDSKVLSNLNPGIRVRDASVFEVSEELFDSESWYLLVDADQRAEVRLG